MPCSSIFCLKLSSSNSACNVQPMKNEHKTLPLKVFETPCHKRVFHLSRSLRPRSYSQMDWQALDHAGQRHQMGSSVNPPAWLDPTNSAWQAIARWSRTLSSDDGANAHHCNRWSLKREEAEGMMHHDHDAPGLDNWYGAHVGCCC